MVCKPMCEEVEEGGGEGCHVDGLSFAGSPVGPILATLGGAFK